MRDINYVCFDGSNYFFFVAVVVGDGTWCRFPLNHLFWRPLQTLSHSHDESEEMNMNERAERIERTNYKKKNSHLFLVKFRMNYVNLNVAK